MAIYNTLLLLLFLLLLLTSNSSSQSMAQPNAAEFAILQTIKNEWANPAALLLLTSNSRSQSMAQPNAAELAILHTIKNEWGNPAALSSWSTGNWTGITCDNDGQITALSFHNFHIAKPIPASICSLKNLTYIDLSYNNLTGEFPTVLYSCSALQFLDLSNNEFAGSLPNDMSGLGNLTELDLAGNLISGSIPASIHALRRLNFLNLSSNQISGAIPSEIGLLPVLNILDLSNNALSGGIPQEFNNLHLSFLNLSSNQLADEVPKSLQNPAYNSSFLGNRGLCTTVNINMNLRPCGYGGHDKLSTRLIILFSVVAGITLAVTIGWLIVRRQKQRQDMAMSMWKMTPFRALDFSKCDILAKLRDENVIGSGSGGSGKVYRVPLRGRGGAGMVVAVKRLSSTRKSDAKLDKEFDSEVKILGDIRHNNIVSLLCCISSEDTKLLVYEYMENGSLDRWLHHRERDCAPARLDWPTRLAIAIDGARGLSYMHHECAQPIMHRNVKSSNILLDPEFRAKFGDFGLARILVKSGEPESLSAIGGTSGYMAPEYGYRPKVNEKVDVFSFGVVLLELTTGRVANDGGEGRCLAEWAWRRFQVGGSLYDAVDVGIQDMAFLDDAVAVFTLGVICTGDGPTMRPSMKEVLLHLLRYDRTSSVASSCRDEYGHGEASRPGAKKDGQGKMTPFRMLDFTEHDIDFTEHDILSKIIKENVIGSGGSAEVYRIHLGGDKVGHRTVAVKKIGNPRKLDANLDKEFESEVKILGDIRHNNIVSLLCCISGQDTKLIVYEYMENGSLDRWLHHRERAGPLDWPTRLSVAVDVARGLSYMHHDLARPVIHRDVKCSNILLDCKFRAKIADFGLARILAKSGESESTSAVCGTFGYIAPEYVYSAKVSEKVDVYSFGVVLLELATGRGPKYDDTESGSCLAKWASKRYRNGGPLADLVDNEIQNPDYLKDMVAVFELGVVCTGEDPPSRPSMSVVLDRLLQFDRN